MIIVISGTAGSGKSTLAKALAGELGLKYLCAGDMVRKMAQEKKMDVLEFGEYLKNHPELDREVDNTTITEAKKGNCILEGRLSAWMLKENKIPAFKILLNASSHVAARRIVEREGVDFEEALEKSKQREKANWQRYKALYGIDHDDESWYDLVVYTDEMSIEEVFDYVLKAVGRT